MFRTNFICFSSALVHRRVFKHVGLFDESLKLAIDFDLWLRTAAWYWFDYVDEPLVKYRTGHANLSRRTEERLTAVQGIMQRFLDREEGRHCLSPSVVRQAWAETYYHTALAKRGRSRLAALPWYLRCLLRAPAYGLAWQGLGALFLPEALRRRLRIACGRPADWSIRKRAGEEPGPGEARGAPQRAAGGPREVGPTLIRSEA
jgi:hypothetical protein